MVTKTWRPHPLRTSLLEILQRKGAMTDADLYNMVKESQEIGFAALNKELLRLEVQGLIRVTALTRGKRRVELVEREKGRT
ncbi:MAG: transcriptional repressor [Candidatus Bathyarchaeia archaeon]